MANHNITKIYIGLPMFVEIATLDKLNIVLRGVHNLVETKIIQNNLNV